VPHLASQKAWVIIKHTPGLASCRTLQPHTTKHCYYPAVLLVVPLLQPCRHPPFGDEPHRTNIAAI
jgi:hypothetical protein